MRNWVLGFLLLACMALPNGGWAATSAMTAVEILPVSPSEVLVHLEGVNPKAVAFAKRGGHPAIWLAGVRVPNRFLTSERTLTADHYIRRPGFPVTLQLLSQGTWMIFDSPTPVKVLVSTNKSAFVHQAARELAVYTVWPHCQTIGSADLPGLLNRAINAFGQGNSAESARDLEAMYSLMPEPPEALYQLLAMLYLYRDDQVRALVTLSEGASRFPESLGLSYGSLLYELNQPEKMCRVLSDLLQNGRLTTNEDIAFAQFLLGTQYDEAQNYDQAVPFLNASSTVFNGDPKVWFNLGIAYEGSDRPQEALASYKNALAHAEGPFRNEIQSQIDRVQLKTDPD